MVKISKKCTFVTMQLVNYINDLLYRYDCVIVPNFGGFVTNKIGATISSDHIFYPPSKQVSFNSNLKHNDGLLANYVASVNNISFEEANKKIADLVINWKEQLQTSSVEISSIGSLSLTAEKQLIFEPDTNSNFLMESFGLATVNSQVIERFKQEVKPLIPADKKSKKGIPAFVKYAATAAILLTLGVVGYQNNQNTVLSEKQEQLEQKIQQATFVIDTPLPTINLNIESSKKLHIIVGAFEFAENAEKKKTELQNKGFKAKVLGKNKWGLIPVSSGGFATEKEAKKALRKARKFGYGDAWIFVDKTK